jgi:inner membrane protein
VNARAGVVTSQTAWLASLPVLSVAPTLGASARGAAAGFLVAALASFLPDLDHPKATVGRYVPGWVRWILGGHRMGSHSFFAVAGAWWLTGYLLENPIIANAMAVGWLSHIVLDMLTVQGAGVLYPVSRRKFRIGWMRTGSKAEDWFVLGMKILWVLIAIWYAVLGYSLLGGT